MAAKRKDIGGRDALGRFGPGNPGGGRPKIPDKVRKMLAARTPHAAKRLIEALDAEMVVHYQGDEVGTYVDHRTRIMAAEALMNRLYGKPVQAVAGEDGGPVRVGVIIMPPETEE